MGNEYDLFNLAGQLVDGSRKMIRTCYELKEIKRINAELIALGCEPYQYNESKETEKTETIVIDHSPHRGDNVCSKCKSSCGEPVESKNGYGSRVDRIKYTYYCNNCGEYFDKWR